MCQTVRNQPEHGRMPGVPPTEGKNGVPLRFPRPVMATAAITLAVAWTALGSVPALADQVRHQEGWLAKLHVTHAWQTTKGSGVTAARLDPELDPARSHLSGPACPRPTLPKSRRA